MPLFFFISGYLSNRGGHKSGVIKRRSIQLLLPFLTWATISPLLYNGVFNIAITCQKLLYPDNGLWFLYNLFVYSSLFSVAEWINEKKNINKWLVVVIFYLFLGCLMVVFGTKFNCTQLCYYYIFFAFGYIYRLIIDPKKHCKFALMGGVFYILMVPFWSKRGVPLFYDIVNLGNAFAYMYRYIVQIVGMFFFFELGKILLNRKIPFLSEYGKMTLGVYAFQFTILTYLGYIIVGVSVDCQIIIETILTTIICYTLVKIVQRIPYVRTFLIGEA